MEKNISELEQAEAPVNPDTEEVCDNEQEITTDVNSVAPLSSADETGGNEEEERHADDVESRPFIQHDNFETNGSVPNLQNQNAKMSGSMASFREEVYRPTTVAIAKSPPSSRGCCQTCSVCCQVLQSKCYLFCKPVMWKYRALPTDSSTRTERLKYALMCPPQGRFGHLLLIIFVVLLGFGLVWGVTGRDGIPGGTFFGLYVLYLLCALAGLLMPFIRLPPLLGMLIMGCILGNVPRINVARDIDNDWSASIRKVALAVILTRAGLGLDPAALRRMSFVVVRLAFLPCLTEALVCMLTAHYILGLPVLWALMLGFVLAAVSPAVVVPCLLSLSERGLGVDQGIPTLVIAAASIDDVLAISAFSILLGIVFSDTKNIGLTVVQGPMEALGGVLYGVVVGVVLWYLPSPGNKTSNLSIQRSFLLLAGGLFALFGSSAAGIEGAGALGCLTLPFVVALRWRKQLPTGETQLAAEAHMGYLWTIAQPLLFGLIGAAVDFNKIELEVIGKGIAVLLIGLTFRLLVSFLAVFGAGFTMKEKLFIPLAWLPKATVQALIGSTALDTAKSNHSGVDMERWGMQILTIAVLCILLTAPLGAAAITLTGPKLLQKSKRQPSADVIDKFESEDGEPKAADNILRQEKDQKV